MHDDPTRVMGGDPQDPGGGRPHGNMRLLVAGLIAVIVGLLIAIFVIAADDGSDGDTVTAPTETTLPTSTGETEPTTTTTETTEGTTTETEEPPPTTTEEETTPTTPDEEGGSGGLEAP